MKKRTEIVKAFLRKNKCWPEYVEGLEVAALVGQDEGERVNENSFSDGRYTWYNLRISDEESGSKFLGYPEEHFAAVGLSGWNYKTKRSHWVGFDFDDAMGHKQGLPEVELNEIIERAKTIPWLSIRRSTSGRGLHLYVHIADSPEIKSRKEHALLAKVILSQIGVLLKCDFKAKVDVYGGILWVWSRKGNKPDSFKIIKEAQEKLASLPPIQDNEEYRNVASNVKIIELDAEHQKLIDWLASHNYEWWWDSDLKMLVCHTHTLKLAHTELAFRGLFETLSKGRDSKDQNCFLFPMKNGSWIVRRHHKGTKEHDYWKSDRGGWTYCYFNRLPTLEDIATLYSGQETPSGDYIFSNSEAIRRLIVLLAPSSSIELPDWATNRQFRVKQLSAGKLAIYFDATDSDERPGGWIKGKKRWEKVIQIIEEEKEVKTPDSLVRHVVASGKDAGWYLFNKSVWIEEPKDHVTLALSSLDFSIPECKDLLGQCILNPWSLVNKPFKPEYTGNREWNKFAPQLAVEPREGPFPNWEKIINHLAENLSTANSSWCIAHGLSGRDYLMCWLAALFQSPEEPLPYLFFFSKEQQTGKSTLCEAVSNLVTKGVCKADTALVNPQKFTGELAGAILCYVEETNLSKAQGAYDRIKEWVTGKTITIHSKGATPYDLPNTTHWIQTANDPSWCPVKMGDSRIVMIRVNPLKNLVPKREMELLLRSEAPFFLDYLLKLEIPKPVDRLRIPVIETEDKQSVQEYNASPLDDFISERTKLVPGATILYGEFCNRFFGYLQTNGLATADWSKKKISASLPNTIVKGITGVSGYLHLGNVAWNEDEVEPSDPFIKVGDRLARLKGE